jgi:glycosyltransferase involved in cell wall biosynthesis
VAIDRIAVVVPAHDEEQVIGSALDALRDAATVVAPHVETTVVVVANGCTDRTSVLARAHGASVVEVASPNVGAARAAGFAWVLDRREGRVDGLWLASTDADSRVRPDWLATQVHLADRGADAYLGTVALERGARSTFAAWISEYEASFETPTRHGHVHGAAMGMRAEIYRSAGGFRPLEHSEDVDLVTRLVAGGARIAWDATCPVTTSSRLAARAPSGVARDLELSLEPSGPILAQLTRRYRRSGRPAVP